MAVKERQSRMGEETMTRRGFVKGGLALLLEATRAPGIAETIGIAGIKGAEVVDRFQTAYKEQLHVKERANRPVDVFIEENKEELKYVEIGCSFAPERVFPGEGECFLPGQARNRNFTLASLRTDEGKVMQKEAMDACKFAVEELGMRKMRFGIRWENVTDDHGNFDFSFYKPFLDYLTNYKDPHTQEDVQLTLNIGPIKTFGWPEQHVPKSIRTRLRETFHLPPMDAEITPDMKLAQHALEHTDTVLTHIKDNYPTINSFQPDNEAMIRFGRNPWRIGKSQQIEVLKKIYEYFPDAHVLLNCPGAPAVISLDTKQTYADITNHLRYWNRSAFSECREFVDQISQAGRKVTIGLDHYDQTPLSNIMGHMIDSVTVVKALDGMDVFKRHEDANYGVEITEMQAQPWMPYTRPGNDVEDLQFCLLRSSQVLKPQTPSTVRLWGVEYLYNVYRYNQNTEEHDNMVYLTQNINNLSRNAT